MKEKILSIGFFTLVLFIETSITTLPLLIGGLVFFAVTSRKDWVFLIAVITGFIFDVLTLRTIASTSIFFTILVFLIFIYENKFETETVLFVFLSTFISSFIFLIFLGFGNLILQSLVVATLTSLIFRLSSRHNL